MASISIGRLLAALTQSKSQVSLILQASRPKQEALHPLVFYNSKVLYTHRLLIIVINLHKRFDIVVCPMKYRGIF